jgi:hypothetical protein
MFTVTETNDFIAWSAGIWNDAERSAFIDFISQNPLAGDVIPGAGPLARCDGRVKAWANVAAQG